MKIDTSSFSLTRLVTFLPFYMLVNRTKHVIRVCEEGQDQWTEAKPGEVRTHVELINRKNSAQFTQLRNHYIHAYLLLKLELDLITHY